VSESISRNDAAQIRDQYLAIAHLAKQIARVHEQLAPCAESLPKSVCGPQSARLLETLGDICNGMDIVEKEDAWIDPIIEQAHAMYPEVFAASETRCGCKPSADYPGRFVCESEGGRSDCRNVQADEAERAQAARPIPSDKLERLAADIEEHGALAVFSGMAMANRVEFDRMIVAALRTASAARPINQCDGCRRGLPWRETKHGVPIHDDENGVPVMACTADRYTASATRPSGESCSACNGTGVKPRVITNPPKGWTP
jgi:hypothetical protein